ncbi:MAG: acyl carrier protein [Actinobacteria bacterium]|nr:acyl carrier protein [Actinomycetota bacterium]
MSDVKDKIRKFITEEVLFEEGGEIKDDQALVGEVLDSLALMQLVEYLEQEFEIDVADEDVTPANFQTLNDLERYVKEHASS